jgi:hypothetical protein
MQDEEERRRQQRRAAKAKQRSPTSARGRIKELEDVRSELAEKGLVLLQTEQELLDQQQTVAVLEQELRLERQLRALLTKEKEKAEEEAALAMGLCVGGAMLP